MLTMEVHSLTPYPPNKMLHAHPPPQHLLPLLRIQPSCLSSPQLRPHTYNALLAPQNMGRSKNLTIITRRRRRRIQKRSENLIHLTCKVHFIHIKIQHVGKTAHSFKHYHKTFFIQYIFTNEMHIKQ